MQKHSETVPRKHRELYLLNVTNIVTTDGEGRPLDVPRCTPDPTATREFRAAQEAPDAYEDPLVRYDCEWLPSANGESGRQFVGKGNTLAPPPPVSLTRAVWARTSRTKPVAGDGRMG